MARPDDAQPQPLDRGAQRSAHPTALQARGCSDVISELMVELL